MTLLLIGLGCIVFIGLTSGMGNAEATLAQRLQQSTALIFGAKAAELAVGLLAGALVVVRITGRDRLYLLIFNLLPAVLLGFPPRISWLMWLGLSWPGNLLINERVSPLALMWFGAGVLSFIRASRRGARRERGMTG